ncbi:MAG TPA: tyrosine-type recombinase/integrase [Bryobacteraceae bacterium]|nr:tyrosine-type recombinase/integrase [Bryobacteraceae bacterium]
MADNDSNLLSVVSRSLPAIFLSWSSSEPSERIENFCRCIDHIFETWVNRCNSPHTRRAYREDVMTFAAFVGISWAQNAQQILKTTVFDVQAFRDDLVKRGAAPKTLNRRISSLSGFFKYLGAAAAEMRLPVTIPNPAHAQFIPRSSHDPVEETRALSAAQARQLMSLPSSNSVIAARDRAILKLFLYSGVRLATGCRLKIEDFHHDGSEATLRLQEKRDRRRVIGLHCAAADAIAEYIVAAGLTSGPLFRPRNDSRTETLADRPIHPTTMYLLIQSYIEQLPGAVLEQRNLDGSSTKRCLFTPHSLRATTATLLLDAGVDIRKVQELLGHRHVATTQIYDKRRRSTSESASHEVPL